MELKKYILKRMFKPAVAKRAKAMRREKIARAASEEFSDRLRCGRLQKHIGYKFKNLDYLREALVHPGLVGTSKGHVRSNQRLEFLGDAVLQCIITETVFKKFDNMEEGELTKVRIALTRGSFLSELSASLGLPKYLSVAHGSEGLREIPSVAEDLFEAVVGAIYLDAGFERTKEVVMSWYKRGLDDLPRLVQSHNPKGALQELAVRRGDEIEYRLVSQSGPAHKKVFEVEIFVGGKSYGRFSGSSKKAAECGAANAAIGEYKKLFEAEDADTAGKKADGDSKAAAFARSKRAAPQAKKRAKGRAGRASEGSSASA